MMGPRSGRIIPVAVCVSESTKSVSCGNSSVSVRPAAVATSEARGRGIAPISNPRRRYSRDHWSVVLLCAWTGGRDGSSSSEAGGRSMIAVTGPLPEPSVAVRRHVIGSPRVPRAGESSLFRRTWIFSTVSSRSTMRRGAVPWMRPHPESRRTAPRQAATDTTHPNARVMQPRGSGILLRAPDRFALGTESAPVGALLEMADQLGRDRRVAHHADALRARTKKRLLEGPLTPGLECPPFSPGRRDPQVHHAGRAGLQIPHVEQAAIRDRLLERILDLDGHQLVPARQQVQRALEGLGEPIGDEEENGAPSQNAAEEGEGLAQVDPRSLRLERDRLAADPERAGPALRRREV